MKPLWISVLFFVCLSAVPTPSFALRFGPSTSGGGVAVVCRTPTTGEVRNAELLDLYEARTVHGFTLPKSLGTIEDDHLRAVHNTYRLQSTIAINNDEFALKNLRLFLSRAEFTVPGLPLPWLGDTGTTPPLPSGCSLEQVAIFHDGNSSTSQRVEIDSEIWAAFDSLNQAALASHEMYYIYERQLREKTSEGTRSLVAHIYAESGPIAAYDGLPSVRRGCWAEVPDRPRRQIDLISTFYVYSSPNGKVLLQFEQLAGRPMVAKATAEFRQFPQRLREVISGTQIYSEVLDANLNVKARAPVRTTLRQDWEVELRYATGQEMRVALYQKGVKIAESRLTSCDP